MSQSIEEIQRLYNEAAAQCRELEAQMNELQIQYDALTEFVDYMRDRKREVRYDIHDGFCEAGDLLSGTEINGDTSEVCSGTIIEDLVDNCQESTPSSNLLGCVDDYKETIRDLIDLAEARLEEIPLESSSCQERYTDACANVNVYWDMLQCEQSQTSSSSRGSRSRG